MFPASLDFRGNAGDRNCRPRSVIVLVAVMLAGAALTTILLTRQDVA
ncbi:MAG TPA: hypothetical protein VHJ99_11150 [Candidatus Dormibacteraeota bacterium]|nr:hypothetical protein [Candidatus Dormibacteraeota bacterium]